MARSGIRITISATSAAGLLTVCVIGGPGASAALSDPVASARPLAPKAVAVPALSWGSCVPAQPGFQCANARVPLDYGRPAGRKIHLAVIRHLATDPANRIGSLFFNPGGPGGPGVLAMPVFLHYFPEQLQARFDLVSWDPRGVGQSTAVKCFPSQSAENRFLATFPTVPSGRAQVRKTINGNAALGRICARTNSSRLLRHVSTADTARDLDLLREAVGESKLNYLGISYGSFLGATYANMFPNRVRAVVLDGNIYPQAWAQRHATFGQATRGDIAGKFLGISLRVQSDKGLAKTTNAFLNLCGQAGTAGCAFSAGRPRTTRSKYQTLANQLRRHPNQQRGGYTYSELLIVTAGALERVSNWQLLGQILQGIWNNSAARLAGVVRPRQRPGQMGAAGSTYNGIEQAFAIECSDSPNPPSSEYPALATFATKRSGVTGPYWPWIEDETCAGWRAKAAHRYAGPWDRSTAHPILVINNTSDPNTPYQDGVAMSQILARARLLTVDGYGHTAFLNPSICAQNHESRYFIDGALPPEGTRCAQGLVPFPAGP